MNKCPYYNPDCPQCNASPLKSLTQATLQEFDKEWPYLFAGIDERVMYPTQRNIIKAFITQKERAAYLAGIRQVVEKAKDKMYFRTRNNHETAKECAERHNRILDDILHQELSQVEKEKGSRLPVKTN